MQRYRYTPASSEESSDSCRGNYLPDPHFETEVPSGDMSEEIMTSESKTGFGIDGQTTNLRKNKNFNPGKRRPNPVELEMIESAESASDHSSTERWQGKENVAAKKSVSGQRRKQRRRKQRPKKADETAEIQHHDVKKTGDDDALDLIQTSSKRKKGADPGTTKQIPSADQHSSVVENDGTNCATKDNAKRSNQRKRTTSVAVSNISIPKYESGNEADDDGRADYVVSGVVQKKRKRKAMKAHEGSPTKKR